MGINKDHSMVLVGVGNLGKALGSYDWFRAQGFEIKAIFDIDPHLIGNYHGGCAIRALGELKAYLEQNPTDIGIIATPKETGQEVSDLLVQGGVKSIWNFSPTHLDAPSHVIVENIHLTDSLLRLSFRLNEHNLSETGS